MPELFVTSILGAEHGPRVCIETHSQDFQLSPAEAREFALQILEASEAAQQDEMIFRFLTEKLNEPVKAAAAILVEFRKFRKV